MDIGKYKEQKENGVARVLDIDGRIHIACKQYDPNTGEAKPNLVAIYREQVEATREKVAAQLASIDLLLEDLNKPQKV